ncbi:UNVERIFIED_ORG: hypothetical protein J2S99_001448 [Atlantibacter hermannii]|jgi:hypothetical protein|nr:hypothetical protein [Atlantibacter hermannii]
MLAKLIAAARTDAAAGTGQDKQASVSGRLRTENCISCNDGTRHGCSSCAYRLK